jgi:hypothetical protein
VESYVTGMKIIMKYSLQNISAVHFTEKSARISVTSYSRPAAKGKQASNWSNQRLYNKINPLAFSINRAKTAKLLLTIAGAS